MQISRLLFLIFIAIQCSIGVCAIKDESQSDEIERIWDFGIGIGYGSSSNPFIGSDDIPNYISLDFSVYGEKFFFDNGEFGFTVIDKPNFGFNIISTFNSERIYYSYLNELGINASNSNNLLSVSATEPLTVIDSMTIVIPIPNIDGDLIPSPAPPSVSLFPGGDFIISFDTPKRKISYNFGLEFIYDHDFGSLNYQITQDIRGTHGGKDMLLLYSNGMQFKRWSVATEFGFHWKSHEIIDYYYGVDFTVDSNYNITELDLLYEGTSGTDVLFGLTGNYRINNNLSLVASYKFNKFSSSITNSPLIDSDNKQNIFVGLFYRF